MPSLLDVIQSNMASSAPPAGMEDQSQAVRRLLTAKSGKSVGAPTAAMSSIGEQAALDQTNQQLGGIRQQGGVQAAVLNAEQNQLAETERLGRADLGRQAQSQEQQARIQSQQILAELEANRGQLSLDRDRAKLEQLGSNLALQDRQYVDQLKRAGEMNRLDNELAFKQALTKSIIFDAEKLLGTTLNYDALLNQDRRAFDAELQKMKLELEQKLGDMETEAKLEKQKWEAIGKGVEAGAEGYGKWSEKNEKKGNQ